MAEFPVGTCREHVRAFLELHWYLYARKSSPTYGTYVILEHRDYPWFLQLPCLREDAVLDPVLIRHLLRDAGIAENEYAEAFRKANRP